jgi:phage baseplate assembly protein W
VNIAFPMSIAEDGRIASTGYADHVRHMIEQLIFTNPGERVNRPDFGSGLYQLLFAPNSIELAATVQFTMMAALQRYLGDIVEIQSLEVIDAEDHLTIDLSYRIVRTGERAAARFMTAGQP